MIEGHADELAIALVAALATAGIAAGCGSRQASTTATSGGGGGSDLGLITPGTLTIGSDIPYPPFEQGKPPDYTGFDVDLMDAIAKKLNLQPKWVDTAFGTIFSDQQAGKFDIVASSTTITPPREQKVTFSDPYFDADQSLMVQKGSDLQSTVRHHEQTRRSASRRARPARTTPRRRPTPRSSPTRRSATRSTRSRPARSTESSTTSRLGLRAEEVPAARRRPDDPDRRAATGSRCRSRTRRCRTPSTAR